MAENFRFYKIKEANAEIERLTTANLALTEKVSALESNPSEAVAAAEKAIAEKDSEIARLKSHSDALGKEVASNASKLKEASDKVAAIPAEVERVASAKALEIVSAQGLKAPLKTNPNENPKAEKTGIDPALKGLARAKAIHRAETAGNPDYK